MTGQNLWYQKYMGRPAASVSDPKNGGTIGPLLLDEGFCELISLVASETRNLAAPDRSGLTITLAMVQQTSSDTIAVTVLDSAGNTSYTHTFTGTNQFISYESICTSQNSSTNVKTFAWRVKAGTLAALGVVAPSTITDSTGGTASTTFAAITAASTYAQADMVAVPNALSQIAVNLNAIKTALALLQ